MQFLNKEVIYKEDNSAAVYFDFKCDCGNLINNLCRQDINCPFRWECEDCDKCFLIDENDTFTYMYPTWNGYYIEICPYEKISVLWGNDKYGFLEKLIQFDYLLDVNKNNYIDKIKQILSLMAFQ
jgi:hypothetical protein